MLFDRKTIIQALLVLIISILFISQKLPKGFKPELPSAEQLAYFNVALQLYNHGIYSNDPNLDTIKPYPGRYFPPVFTGFLALLMHADSDFAQTVDCSLRYVYIKNKIIPASERFSTDPAQPHDCDIKAGIFTKFQILFLSLVILFIWLTAKIVLKSSVGAWLTILTLFFLDFITGWTTGLGIITDNVKYYLTDIVALLLYSVFLFALAYGVEYKKWQAFGFASFILGLTTLTRPQFGYIYYVLMPFGLGFLFLQYKKPHQLKKFIKPSALLFFSKSVKISLLMFALTVLPWSLRNHSHFNSFALTDGYGPMILSQRVAYNDMNSKEYFSSFLYWIPVNGQKLATRFVPDSELSRLKEWNEQPLGFARYGLEVIYPKALESKHPASYLIMNYVLSNPFKHVAVGLPLMWRGILFDCYLSFFLIASTIFASIYAFRKKWFSFIILIAPSFFILTLHSMLSLNVSRYNMILLPCMAIALSFCIMRVIKMIKNKIKNV